MIWKEILKAALSTDKSPDLFEEGGWCDGFILACPERHSLFTLSGKVTHPAHGSLLNV
jgi:hypothetical protein